MIRMDFRASTEHREDDENAQEKAPEREVIDLQACSHSLVDLFVKSVKWQQKMENMRTNPWLREGREKTLISSIA